MTRNNKSQIKFNNGIYKAIALHIPSKKSASGHLSPEYVSKVLNGKVTRDNHTTRAIKEKAAAVLDALNR